MRLSTFVAAALCATLCLACKDKGAANATAGDTAAKPVGGAKLDPGQEFLFKGVQDDVTKVKQQLTAGEDPTLTCAKSSVYAEELKNAPQAKTAVDEMTKLCTYDVPLAALDKAVTAAETARKAAPTDPVLSECFSATQSMATEELKKNFADDAKFTALVARWNVACPAK